MKPTRFAVNARILGVLVALGVAVFPLYWMFTTALTSQGDLFGDSVRLVPDLSRIGVFGEALSGDAVATWLTNSFLISAGTTLVALGLLMTQMLPEALLVVPLFSIFQDFGLLNSRIGLVLANSAFVMPICALILKGAIDGIPREIEEAARVDGCRPLTILTRINLPLILPSLSAAAVISFFHAWNEYVFAVTFTFDLAKRPASVGLAGFIGELGTPLPTIMAVAFMFTLPAVAFYLFAQRYVVAGMTAGAVKG